MIGDMAGSRSPGLGHLERSVMDVLWSAAAPVTAREVHGRVDRGGELAYATVKTVLDRLARKELVVREPAADSRALTYRAAASRDAYVAELMHAALDTADDRTGALARFAERMSAREANVLRKTLPGRSRS